MKIKDILNNKKTLSFEVFPPKRDGAEKEAILKTVDELAAFSPDFMSVTYSAGGSNSKSTAQIASYIKNHAGVEALAHMTGGPSSPEEIDAIARELQTNNIENVLATVKGDVHDIGKNICKTVIHSYGYEVIDLGKDVPPELVVEACMEHKPLAVGLSALMTTTVGSMANTISALRASGCTARIFVDGAVLTQELAYQMGADFYTQDALEFVRALEGLER